MSTILTITFVNTKLCMCIPDEQFREVSTYPIRNFLGNIQGLRWAGLQCHVRFLWDWPTHYRGLMSGICRVYWGKLPTMRPTIYSSLWWDNPTSSPNNVGTSHALPRSFPTMYPGYNNGVSIENPLLFLNKQIRL